MPDVNERNKKLVTAIILTALETIPKGAGGKKKSVPLWAEIQHLDS